MRIVPKSRIAYINPPRTATMYIEDVLREATGNRVFTPSAKLSGHHTVYAPKWEDFHWFVSVRHPYTRCVSIWRRLIEHEPPGRAGVWKEILATRRHFEDVLLCDLPYVREYWQFLPCKQFTKDVPRVDTVVRQESLAEDLAKVPGLNSRIKRVTRNKPHASQDRTPWHKWFTPECITFIQETFAADFEAYGYTRDFEAVKRGEYTT